MQQTRKIEYYKILMKKDLQYLFQVDNILLSKLTTQSGGNEMARSAKRKMFEQKRKQSRKIVKALLSEASSENAKQRLDSPRQWANHNPHKAEGMAEDMAGLRLGYRRADSIYLEYRATRNDTKRKVQQRQVKSKKSGTVWHDAVRAH